MWIKTTDDAGTLKTSDEILKDMQKQGSVKKKKGLFG
jgi:hypothetical protein